MRVWKSCVAFTMAVTLTVGAAVAEPSDSLRLVDLTAKFDEVATATAGLDEAARVAAFEKAMDGIRLLRPVSQAGALR